MVGRDTNSKTPEPEFLALGYKVRIHKDLGFKSGTEMKSHLVKTSFKQRNKLIMKIALSDTCLDQLNINK